MSSPSRRDGAGPVLVVAQPADGGVHRHVASIVPRLAERGYEVIVAGPRSYASVPGATHVPLDMVRGIDPRADAAAARGLAALARRVRPALVHAHSSKAGALVRALRPVLGRTPVVYTPHGYAFAGHFESEAQRAAYRLVEAGLSRLTSLTLCVCEFERQLAARVGPLARTRVVHNGVELPSRRPAPDPRVAELAARGPVVGALSLLRPGKGVETLVEAAPAILRDRPGVSIAVAGDGALRPELERRIAAAGLEGRVVLLGQLPNAAALLAGTTIAVNPSWAESFPYAVLESMAAGIPMVSTAVGGVHEALEDGRSGVLVAPRDAAALAAAVGGLLDDPACAAAISRAAQARAVERFSLGVMADGVTAVYAELGVAAPR